MDKRIALVFRQSPFDGNQVQETIDIGLAYAAYDQAVTLIFTDDAVSACCDSTKPEKAGYANFLKQFGAFDMYDIEEVWVNKQAMKKRGLAGSRLRESVQFVDENQIASSLSSFDIVLSI
ncbi:sulfurtransferase complex subunit TusC [Corallincola platygyrae]|uniref:Sulfurtransferase complex subunit TusC n=1 Tax=Corallincola platygyrae TaxID=1193278 RepID=A0ABW4XKY2_9GAMM